MPRPIQTAGAVLPVIFSPTILSARSLNVARTVRRREENSSQPEQIASAQSPGRPDASTKPQKSASTTKSSDGSKQRKKQAQELPNAPQPSQNSSDLQQTNRMMWIVPNFAAVSPGVKFEPMTPKQKFWMATEDSFDYSSFAWTGVMAAQDYALDSYPELGTGASGYSRYYWRGLLDGISNSYFSEAIVPVMTHEDSRYFTLGHGGIFRRLGYALSRVVVTYSDSGRNTFNVSEVGGDFASAALSTAYYPPQERGMVKISEGWGTQLESAALNNIAKEFWPDIRKDIFRRH
jgi:hypothetical protein